MEDYLNSLAPQSVVMHASRQQATVAVKTNSGWWRTTMNVNPLTTRDLLDAYPDWLVIHVPGRDNG